MTGDSPTRIRTGTCEDQSLMPCLLAIGQYSPNRNICSPVLSLRHSWTRENIHDGLVAPTSGILQRHWKRHGDANRMELSGIEPEPLHGQRSMLYTLIDYHYTTVPIQILGFEPKKCLDGIVRNLNILYLIY